MGPLRPARGAALAFVLALLVPAGVVLAAGPVAGSVGTEPVRVRADLGVIATWADPLDAAYDARMTETLLVFGDSISARYDDRPRSRNQGFWSMIADDVGARPRVLAEGGSGFVNPGLVDCRGRTLLEQLATPGTAAYVADAGAVIVEGGRTDTQTCAPGGGYDAISTLELREAATAFFAEVARLRGRGDECTIVLVPWGPAGSADTHNRVTWEVYQAATRFGFTFVWTEGLLTAETTVDDGVHPSRAGNRNLADAVLSRTAARSCF
jgi:lysophospholipase L1-like esterase